jgi:hypothetical protein
VTYPPSGQPWSGQPEQNQPQYGGYPTPPLSGPPYNQGSYETGGYQQESYTTEPPMSGGPYQGQQPYDPNYGAPQQAPYAAQQPPPYQGYAPPQQTPSFVTPPAPRNNRGGMLALVIGGIVILLILVGVGTALVLRSGEDDPVASPTTGTSSTEASPAPTEAGEYPARIDLPQTMAGLTKVTDNATLNQTANETAQQIKTATNADSAVAAYYAPSGDLTKAVGLVGATGRITDPESELEEAFSGELGVSGVTDVDAGPLGGTMQCGTTASSGQALTVCGWADGGSLMLGIFVNRSQTESASLFRTIRSTVLKRG